MISNEIKITDFRLYKDCEKIDIPFKPTYLSFKVEGIFTSIINGIRRLCLDELPSKRLMVSINDIFTNDEFIIKNLIQERLRSIPINQKIPLATKFSLNVSSKKSTELKQSILSKEIVNPTSIILCNPNFVLFDLLAERNIKIKNIYIEQTEGFNDGRHNNSFLCYVKNLSDQPSLKHDSILHEFVCGTNGEISPVTLINNSINLLITKLENAAVIPIISKLNNHSLIIKGESFTLGNILIDSIYYEYPKISAITPKIDRERRIVELVINHTDVEEIKKIINKGIGNTVKILKNFQNSINAAAK